jgi:hypothetical protein
MLRSAAQSGGVPMAATHLLLSQDPEYARAINSDPQLRALNIEVFDDIDKLKADDARVFSLPEKAKPTDRQPTFGIPEE